MTMKWAFIAANITHGLGLQSPAHEGMIAAGTGADIASMMRSFGYDAITVEELDDEPESSGNLPLSGATVFSCRAVREELLRHETQAIIPFKPSAPLIRAAEGLGMRVLAPQPRLVRQLENKLALLEIAEAAGVQIPVSRPVVVDEFLSTDVQREKVEFPCVFQGATGYAGGGTVIAHDAQSLAASLAKLPKGSVGKLVDFVEGAPLTVSGVVLSGQREEVLVGPPCRQITGVSQCTAQPLGSCGNEWGLPIDPEVASAARAMAADIGAELGRRSFRGAFGIDLVAGTDGKLWLIEVNPRWTANLSVLIDMQMQMGVTTLLECHMGAFASSASTRKMLVDAMSVHAQVPTPTTGATVSIHNSMNRRFVPNRMTPGVYRKVDSQNLEWVREGWRISDIISSDEFVVLPRCYRRVVTIGPEVGRVLFPQAVLRDDSARELTDYAAGIVGTVAQTLGIEYDG